MKVTFIAQADWAGSCFQAVKSLQKAGVDARQILMGRSDPYEFDYDIHIPSEPVHKGENAKEHPKYNKCVRLLESCDIIHVWNDLPNDVEFINNGFDLLSFGKPMVNTYTGSLYRKNKVKIEQEIINLRSTRNKNYVISVTFQNPNFVKGSSLCPEFIPHAVDCEKLETFLDIVFEKKSSIKNRPVKIGMYVGNRVEESFSYINRIVKEFRGKFKLINMDRKKWFEHLKEVCSLDLYIQDVDENIGYVGRSALEACAMRVPCIALVKPEAKKVMDMFYSGMGTTPYSFLSNRISLPKLLNDLLLNIDEYDLKNVQQDWVKKFFSFDTVSEKYLKIYNKIIY
ncbi:MAG: hypothetical protein GF317_04740 [Candidatus Lokiarchaeota archaeon]|nr:hypothetical protein [Candidatus Lokiarchaeota archaeon]